ncbi:MAG TPA: methionyl-tRNA formyltransferase [Candidatus Udaeobacter sp.]
MRIVFIGSGDVGLPTLQALLKSEYLVVGAVTQPDKPVGRAQLIEPPPIKKALAGAKIPILQPPRIKERQAIEEIRALMPDVIVVAAYGQILPRDVLEIPKIACLNLHASLLPRWRGAAPIQAVIVAGDTETGITVMYMNEGLDTGDIMLQHKTNILPAETGGSLHDRLAKIAPETLFAALRLLAKGNAPRIPQDNTLATYAPKLKREHAKIDWSESADVIERKIRAFNPWPGAFMTIDGKNLKIFSASIADFSDEPGKILRSDKELAVAAGTNAVSLGEVQLEGKRRMSVAEFLRGHPSIARTAS